MPSISGSELLEAEPLRTPLCSPLQPQCPGQYKARQAFPKHHRGGGDDGTVPLRLTGSRKDQTDGAAPWSGVSHSSGG
ncbi:hypothetical protein MDA_GLEAN10020952 [Myotis davidii]|uniref:Uncharacterized protein n=1 Tax=Myotis davidii TaxID=225400 RepID=L5M3H5_MYODS|nr:hypothetical protein MDA_GLEAN10020952 [Myotis davidii]